MTDGRDGRVVILIGPPGSGKSRVGARLAQRWGVGFRDTDVEIEQAQGRSISDIFVDDGEAVFRALEKAEVATSVRSHAGVLALGGGSIVDPDTQQVLAGHQVVFLDVGIADASKRVGFDTSRPLLAVNPRASWVRLMEARREIYERLATLRVDTAGRAIDDVVAQIAAHFGPDA